MSFLRATARQRRFAVPLFFGLLLLLGVALHRDYGVSWDESVDHLNGVVNATYILQRLAPELARRESNHGQIPALKQYGDNDHGVLIELPLTLLGRVLTHGDPRSFYFLRHLCLFGLFVVGVWALYRIASLRFGDWRLGLGVAAILVISPRFFAEAFYNAKDIGFLIFFTLAMYALLRYARRPTYGRALVHGLATAAAIDVRLLGLLVLPLTAMLLLLRYLSGAYPAGHAKLLLSGGLYLLATAACTVLGWPYLWEAPFTNLLYAFVSLSHFHWDADVLYWGRLRPAAQLPWHYLPVWIIITTPLAYLLLALLGTGLAARQYLRRPLAYLQTEAGQLDLLFLCWLLLPVMSVIILHSVVYDGWRHVYFIYPALLLMAGRAVAWLVGLASWRPTPLRRNLRRGALALLLLSGLRTLVLMVQMHPFQQVYFSFLPARAAERLFERDYWGLSYRQGVAWLVRHRSAPQLTLSASSLGPLYDNAQLLPAAERARLRYVRQPADAQYFITNYRHHPQPYPDSVGREIYAIRADGLKILSIFERLPRTLR